MYLLCHRKVRKSLFLWELPLQRFGGVVGTENLCRQPRHEGLQVLVQDAARGETDKEEHKNTTQQDTWMLL